MSEKEQDDFAKSPLGMKLLADMDAIADHGALFDAEYTTFIDRPVDALAKVLRSHLLVEHYLNDYLAANAPAVQDWTSARLTFAQKLALAYHDGSVVRALAPGLRNLNSLRNTAAHTLQADVALEKIGPIVEFVTIWHRGWKKALPKTPMEFIEAFTLIACTFLATVTSQIQRLAKGRGLPGLIEWFNDKEQP